MKGTTLEKMPEAMEVKPVKEPRGRLQLPELHLPFAGLRREMNRLFDEFLHPYEEPWFRTMEEFGAEISTRIDMKETENEIVVTAELPGVKMEDIELTVLPDRIRIKGEKKEEKEEKEKGRYRIERSYGCFARQLPLPCAVIKEGVEATYKNGVLKVVLPKSREMIHEEHKVEVRKG